MGYFKHTHLRVSFMVLVACLVLLTTLLVTSHFALAAPPPSTMNFQGRLRDDSGNIKPDGLYNMQFRIYTASTGGSAVWSESRTGANRIQLTNGLFSTQLGEVTPLPASLFDNTNLYFEITMATPATATTSGAPTWESPMTPRNKLATSAYAFNAAMLNGKTDADFAAANGSANYIQNTTDPQTANFNISGSGQVDLSLTVGTGSGRGVIMRKSNIGSGTSSNLVVLNNDGGSNRAAFYAASSNGNSLEAGRTSGWSTKITTSTSNIGLVIQGASGQTADMLQVQDSTGLSQVRVDQSGNMVFGAGKTISMVGGATSLRPASPSEGTIYFDTDTKQLMTYANGKWQGDRSTATKIVAASNSSQALKDSADYVADGTGDQVEINAALTAASGGKVYLTEGTYTANETILVPNNTTLQGAGSGTEIRLADIDTTDNLIENADTSTGTGITIRDLKLNGQKGLNTSGTIHGIYLNGMGDGSGSSVRVGANISSVHIHDFRSEGLHMNNSDNNTVTSSKFVKNYQGIVTNGERNVISNNQVFNGHHIGMNINGSLNTISNNIVDGSVNTNIQINNGSSNNIADNVITNSNINGVYLYQSPGTKITSNTIVENLRGINVNRSNQVVISSNRVSGNTSYGINFYPHITGAIVSDNQITDNTILGLALELTHDTQVNNNYFDSNGSTTDNNAIMISNNASRNQIRNNTIKDADGCTNTCYAISIDSSSPNSSINGNKIVGGTISDAATTTEYISQIDSSGKLYSRATGSFAVQNSSGTDVLNINSSTSLLTINGDSLYKSLTNSTSAFVVQNSSSTAIFTVDTANSKVVIGSVANGVEFSANGMVLTGTARGTDRVTLSAEYPGLTFQGDGSSNIGDLTSDFCSQPLGINASACSTGQATSYYQWATSESTPQDYDLYLKLRYPDRASASSAGGVVDFTVDGYATDSGVDIVNMTVYKGSTMCGSYNVSPADGWSTTSIAGLFATCDFTAGEEMVIQINMMAGQGNVVRVGDIELTYRTQR